MLSSRYLCFFFTIILLHYNGCIKRYVSLMKSRAMNDNSSAEKLRNKEIGVEYIECVLYENRLTTRENFPIKAFFTPLWWLMHSFHNICLH